MLMVGGVGEWVVLVGGWLLSGAVIDRREGAGAGSVGDGVIFEGCPEPRGLLQGSATYHVD